MPRLSLWNDKKTYDFSFIDRIVGEHLYAGGTKVLVHKYLGIQDSVNVDSASQAGSGTGVQLGEGRETFIQDVLFLENRDRDYDETLYELRGQYNILDSTQYDLTQFGLFLTNDTLYMDFHIESMVETLGRKLMPGDVLELTHLRDDLLLGTEGAINRFYEVKEGARPYEGYDPRWWPHLWKVKLEPITDSQEFADILDNPQDEFGDGTGDDLRSILSQYDNDIAINDALIDQAENDVKWDPQYRDNVHLYYDPEVPDKPTIGFDYGAGGSEPPNGQPLAGSGAVFPDGLAEGDYFLRTDFQPNRLFRKGENNRWIRIADDNKHKWAAADRLLTTYINNTDTTTYSDGEVADVRTNLSKVVKPKTDD